MQSICFQILISFLFSAVLAGKEKEIEEELDFGSEFSGDMAFILPMQERISEKDTAMKKEFHWDLDGELKQLKRMDINEKINI